MNRPTLSILITTYNRAAYLRQCLESIVPTSVDCEIVVMDNASPDDTTAVVRSFTDSRIRHVRHATNLGAGANFARAFAEARGRYLTLIGDDDQVLPGNFERKLAVLEAHPEIGLIYSKALRMDAEGKRHDPLWWPGLVDYSYVGGRPEFMDLLQASYMSLQTVIFRRELYEQYGGLDHPDPAIVSAPSDWQMLLTYCHDTQTAFLAEPLVAVRVHAGGNSAGISASGQFAEGRLAVWRHWLVNQATTPVLDTIRWQALADAFVPDLDHEFNGDPKQVAHYLSGLAAIRAANRAKAAAGAADTAEALTDVPPMSAGLCSCWRCRVRRFLRHWQ